MPKIKKWNNPKKFLPIPGKTCLIKTGDYDYRVVTLEAYKYSDEKSAKIIFRDWSDHDGSRDTSISDVIAWAYLDLD